MNKILCPLVQSSQVHTPLDIHSYNHQLSTHPSTHVFPPPNAQGKGIFLYWTLSLISNLRELSFSLEGRNQFAAYNSALRVCFLDTVLTPIMIQASRSGQMRHLFDLLCSPTETSRPSENDTTAQHLQYRVLQLAKNLCNCKISFTTATTMSRSELLSRKLRQCSLSQPLLFLMVSLWVKSVAVRNKG